MKVRQFPEPFPSCMSKVSNRRYRMQTWNWDPLKQLYTQQSGLTTWSVNSSGPADLINLSSPTLLSVAWFFHSQFLQQHQCISRKMDSKLNLLGFLKNKMKELRRMFKCFSWLGRKILVLWHVMGPERQDTFRAMKFLFEHLRYGMPEKSKWKCLMCILMSNGICSSKVVRAGNQGCYHQ